MDGRDDRIDTCPPPRRGAVAGLLLSIRTLHRKMSDRDIPPFDQIPLGRFIVLSFLACGAFNAFVFLSVIPQAPEALHGFHFLCLLLSFALCAGTLFLVAPCSIIFLLFPPLRKLGIRLLLLGVIYFATLAPLGSAADRIQTASFHDLAERSMPLVNVVRAYETAEGHPPKSLEELVPKYLDSVPSTGLAAYPNYEIHMGEESSMWKGNPWVLCVPVGRGLNFDLFLYFPNQNYPPDERSAFERMGDWAYYHE